MPGIVYQGSIVFPAATILCTGLWYLYFSHKKFFWLVFIGFSLAAGFLLYPYLPSLLLEARLVGESFMGIARPEPVKVTLFALFVIWLVIYVLFFLSIIIKKHKVLSFLFTVILLLTPLFGIWAGIGVVFLLLLFQATLITSHMAGYAKRRGIGVREGKAQLAARSSMAMGGLVLFVFIIATPLTIFFSDKLYNSVYHIEGYLRRSISNITGTANKLVKGGAVSRRNNYQTGEKQLMITSTKKIKETIYLRGFEGGIYTGGNWKQADDAPLLEQVAKNMGWLRWVDTITDMYQRMYFTMNNMWASYSTKVGLMTIQHINGDYEVNYAPYYGLKMNGEAYNLYEFPEDGYGYWFYEQKDLDINWEFALWDYDTQQNLYYQIQQFYEKEAQQAYTQVPVELIPRLAALCRENPQQSLDEITAFILYTLQSNAVYSLTPGWAPLNEDIVDYFLFERKSGYCVHFASAATLMYRLYGIPARYASGYVVPPSAFQFLEAGKYEAEITDEFAHAWVEIFLEGYGWTPVEVTPSSERTVSYPGFNGITLEQVMKQQGWNMDIPSLKEEVEKKGEQAKGEYKAKWISSRTIFSIIGVCCVWFVCIFLIGIECRRWYQQEKLKTMDCRKIFDRLIMVLHFGGVMQNYNGQEKDFVDRLAKEVPDISPPQAQHIIDIVTQAAYGQKKIKEIDQEFVREEYQVVMEFIYNKLKWHKKIIWNYFK